MKILLRLSAALLASIGWALAITAAAFAVSACILKDMSEGVLVKGSFDRHVKTAARAVRG